MNLRHGILASYLWQAEKKCVLSLLRNVVNDDDCLISAASRFQTDGAADASLRLYRGHVCSSLPEVNQPCTQRDVVFLGEMQQIIHNQPTVKKPSLNKEDLSNYRPIANLSFIFKLTEKIVKKRILDHLTYNSLLNPFQSAYTKFYSTETTLLSLHDHLSNAISM